MLDLNQPLNKAEQLLLDIDYSLLRVQKNTLLDLLLELPTEQADHLLGLLGLIDKIQDYAVEEIGLSEEDVFNFNEE